MNLIHNKLGYIFLISIYYIHILYPVNHPDLFSKKNTVGKHHYHHPYLLIFSSSDITITVWKGGAKRCLRKEVL